MSSLILGITKPYFLHERNRVSAADKQRSSVNLEKDPDLESERRRAGSYRPGAVAAIVVNWNGANFCLDA